MNKINTANSINYMNFKGKTNLNMNNNADKPDDKFEKLIKDTLNHVANRTEAEVPQNGKFFPIGSYMKQAGKDAMGKISIQYDPKDPKDKRMVVLGVCHSYSDKIYSNIMYCGTKKEIISYLKDEKNYPEFIKTIDDLTKALDENLSSM